jgi:hypothetical protein
MKTSLNLTAAQLEQLKVHLFPGDGQEAVAIALCGRLVGNGTHRLLIHKIGLFRTYCAKMLINSSQKSFAGIKYEKVNDKYTKFTWRDSRRLQTDSRNIDFSSKITNKNSKLPSLRSM